PCRVVAPADASAVGMPSRLLFRFFQAEDGIRDWSVTGVQTCALPISATPPSLARPDKAGSASRCILYIARRKLLGTAKAQAPTGDFSLGACFAALWKQETGC